MIRLDTHVVVWLYAGEVQRLSPAARELLESEDAVISPIVQLELAFLHEVERITVTGEEIVADLAHRIGLASSTIPMKSVVAEAASLRWTRDPFDRMIVGDALAAGADLLTKDATIREHSDCARW